MTVSSILDAVREGWNFIWPPCFLLLVLIAIARILAPLSLKELAAYLGRLLRQQKKVIALLRVYGLRKFVGIIEAFVILFLLYVLRLAIPIIGDAIPGQMTYTPSTIFVQTVDRESLGCALASVPGATVDTLQEEINIRKKAVQAKMGLGKEDSFFGSQYWQEKNGDLVTVFNVSKALMVYAVVVALVEIIWKRKVLRPLGFLFLVLTALVLLAAYLFGEQAYAHEQEAFALVRDARIIASLDGFSCPKIPTVQLAEIRKQLWEVERNRANEPAWRLEFYDYYLTWLRTRLIPRKVPAEERQLFFKAYSPAVPDHKRLTELVAGAKDSWHARVPETARWDIAKTVASLLAEGYVLPTTIKDDHELTGSLLRSDPAGTYEFFSSPSQVLAPLEFLRPEATAEQKHLCPQGFSAEVEQLKQSEVKTVGRISVYNDLRDLLVETEKLTCFPRGSDPAEPLVIGYKLARIQ